jgi:hypothetical protein
LVYGEEGRMSSLELRPIETVEQRGSLLRRMEEAEQIPPDVLRKAAVIMPGRFELE